MTLLPDRAVRAFPLLLLALLAGLALLLQRATELPDNNLAANPRDPDLTISRFAATGYGVDGKPVYQLNADSMQHYPGEQARVEFRKVHLARTLADSPTLRVDAELARVSQGGQAIWFERAVQLQQDAYAKQRPLMLNTSRLSLNTETGIAESDAPLQLKSPGMSASAIGFKYDQHTAQLELRNQVRMRYAPTR